MPENAIKCPWMTLICVHYCVHEVTVLAAEPHCLLLDERGKDLDAARFAYTYTAITRNQSTREPHFMATKLTPALVAGATGPADSKAYNLISDSEVIGLGLRTTKAGAKVMRPAFEIPGVGRIVILQEPGGAGVGWMTPAN